ncbi:MAG: hypothetical protein STSR0002_12000 [Smithella sp.]|jgi:hypothetical protein
MTKNIILALILIVLLSNFALANTRMKVCNKKDSIKAEELAASAANGSSFLY